MGARPCPRISIAAAWLLVPYLVGEIFPGVLKEQGAIDAPSHAPVPVSFTDAAVSGFAQRGGLPFGIKPKALWEAMSRSGKSLVDPGRNDTTAKIEGKTKRIIQIPRELVVDEDEAS